jgi:putative ABC transport system permease protein
MWQDVRQGVRMLVKSPVFTVTIALTLGLGIGANAAIFSIVNALLLRPLPVADPSNLYILSVAHPGNDQPHGLSYADFVDYRDRAGVFSDLAAYDINFAGLSTDNRADRIAVAYVTGNFFSMLGVGASPGRPVLPSEGTTAGADAVVVLGRSYWKKRFNADASVVGRRVLVNGQPFVVAGVVPEGFHGVYALVEFDAYMPLAMMFPASAYKELVDKRENHELHILGRLRPGLTRTEAQARLNLIARQLEQQYPSTNKAVRALIIPEKLARPEPNAGNSNPLIAGIFLFLVTLVLLVACVNVVNLLMVRATVRQRELAVRAALGAGRARLVRQMLTEGLLLAILGALAGGVLGRWMSVLLTGIRIPADIPIRLEFGFDWRVFAYIAAIALGTGLFVGLIPALRASRTDLNEVLRQGGRSMAEGSGRHRFRSVLVVSQVAVSLILLIAAGLFVRSVQRAQSVDLGFDPRHVLTLSMDVSQLGLDEAHGRAFYQDVQARVRTLPGAELVTYAFSVPFGYYNSSEYVEAEDHPTPGDQPKPNAAYNVVGPEYFTMLKIPLVRGRAFTAQDDERGRRVAVVNEFMAKLLWPGKDPIGKRFKPANDPLWREVVGVTRTGKYRFIFEDPAPYYYEPIAQHYEALRVLQIRTTGDPEAMAPLVEKEVRALNPDLPVYDVRSLDHTLDGPNGFFLLRMGAMFGGALGLLGLLLALVGIYGVVSYTASQRTQEIGVRMALGAQRRDILALVVGHGFRLIAVGVVLGLLAALALSRVLSNVLFGISATDPATFITVPLLLGLMALIASYLPALRATRIAPSVALRNE